MLKFMSVTCEIVVKSVYQLGNALKYESQSIIVIILIPAEFSFSVDVFIKFPNSINLSTNKISR